MIDIEKRRIDRARLMNALFDSAGGSEDPIVNIAELARNLSLSDQDAGDAARYLEGEGLIKGHWYLGSQVPQAQLTHLGIREIEEQRERPTVATAHFPAYNVINIAGEVVNSPIQQGTVGSTQAVAYTSDQISQILTFTAQLRQSLTDLGLDLVTTSEVEAEMTTVEAQARSPKPRHDYIRNGLRAIEMVLQGAAVSAASAGLLDLLSHIPH